MERSGSSKESIGTDASSPPPLSSSSSPSSSSSSPPPLLPGSLPGAPPFRAQYPKTSSTSRFTDILPTFNVRGGARAAPPSPNGGEGGRAAPPGSPPRAPRGSQEFAGACTAIGNNQSRVRFFAKKSQIFNFLSFERDFTEVPREIFVVTSGNKMTAKTAVAKRIQAAGNDSLVFSHRKGL